MLALTLDLPESAYRAALDLPPAERVRRAAAFTDETETTKTRSARNRIETTAVYIRVRSR
ncbi:MAG: hypothetical protein H8F28_23090 [Fibrella sp.]|nr:hypothetical protein [Armatimonadota bacterium]